MQRNDPTGTHRAQQIAQGRCWVADVHEHEAADDCVEGLLRDVRRGVL
jgi:hypothetical protein